MITRIVLLSIALLQEPHTVRDEIVGIEVALPGPEWTLIERLSSVQDEMCIRLYAPEEPPETRFTVIQLPVLFGDTLLVRASQIGVLLGGENPPVTATEIAGQPAERMQYDMSGLRSVEVGVLRGLAFQILQITAPIADWEDPERAAELNAVLASVRLFEPAETVPDEFPMTTPEQVRAARARAGSSQPAFAIRSHDIRLDVTPATGAVKCADRLVVEALRDAVDSFTFFHSHLDLDAVTLDGVPLDFERTGTLGVGTAPQLVVKLPRPLAAGETVELDVDAQTDDYFFAFAQDLVAEVEMLGQVREGSSFSSHVVYYPIDPKNDAEVRLAITVPEGFTAVSGGEALAPEKGDGVTTFRFQSLEQRPRLLPFGFAVGRYEVLRGTTSDGLTLELFHSSGAPELAERARQYLDLGLACGDLFRKRMGPLPWNRVAICVVDPERRETGVSLPGQILLSDGFFHDLSGLEPSAKVLSDRSAMDWLIVPDELSHQWNVYATPLPNELGEGVSTFTNLLFLEQEAGHEEYQGGVRFCAQAYLKSVPRTGDVAVADPALYQSAGYRVIAFCKVAAVLAALRERLGDEKFFAGFRAVFDKVRARDTAYEDFCAAFSAAADEDLTTFFDDWFFRPGRALLKVTWAPIDAKRGEGVDVTLEQMQNTPPFQIDVDVRVVTVSGEHHEFRMPLRGLRESKTFQVEEEVAEVLVDPKGVALLEVVQVDGPVRGQ